jgi:GNAT superfamily N-acetyltransferase
MKYDRRSTLIDIREYKSGDEKGILNLFNEIYTASREEEYWRWQFMENPWGESVIVVAEEDSKIIGQCTLIPTKIIINDKEILAGHSVDTMISKEYRGKGIYEKMAKKSYELAALKGIEIRVGFPTNEALRGLLGDDISAALVGDIPLLLKPYKLDNFLSSIIKLKPLAKALALPSTLFIKFIYKEKTMKINKLYIFKEVKEFNEDFDILWDKIKISSQIMTKRDSEFLNWRIKNHPKNHYKTFGAYLEDELMGYMVVKIEERSLRGKSNVKLGSIVDMIGIDESILTGLYLEAKKYFKVEKIDFVVSWASESMKYRQFLVKLGFFKSRSLIAFVVKDLTQKKELENYIINEKNWYVMPIESDIY